MSKVKVAPIQTTAGTYYVLKNADNRVLYNAPNKWKTRRGAESWATNNGYSVQTSAKRQKQQAKKAPAPCKPAAKTPKKRKTGEKSCRK